MIFQELGECRNANKEAIAVAERAKREEGRAAAAAKKPRKLGYYEQEEYKVRARANQRGERRQK